MYILLHLYISYTISNSQRHARPDRMQDSVPPKPFADKLRSRSAKRIDPDSRPKSTCAHMQVRLARGPAGEAMVTRSPRVPCLHFKVIRVSRASGKTTWSLFTNNMDHVPT